MRRFIPRWKDVKHAIHRIEHKVVARVALTGHLAYYGLVTLEAHGHYRWAAMVVGIVLLVESFMPTGAPPDE